MIEKSVRRSHGARFSYGTRVLILSFNPQGVATAIQNVCADAHTAAIH